MWKVLFYTIYYICYVLFYILIVLPITIIEYISSCTIVRIIFKYFYPPIKCIFTGCNTTIKDGKYCFTHTCHLILCDNPVITNVGIFMEDCYCSKHQFDDQDYQPEPYKPGGLKLFS